MWRRFHGSELRVRRKRVRSICGGVGGGGIHRAEGGAKQKRKPESRDEDPGPRGKGEGPQGAAATRKAVL